jgi:hypothetical protein
MSVVDPEQPTDGGSPTVQRIQLAMEQGPDMGARGRFGKITQVARRLVGRTVKFERDFNLQIDLALLERIHEIEAAAGRQVRDAEVRLNGTDDLLRHADEVLRGADQQLREADHRTNRDLAALTERFLALEATVDELRSQLREVDARAVVASSLAAGAADGFASLRPGASRPAEPSAPSDAAAIDLVEQDAKTR